MYTPRKQGAGMNLVHALSAYRGALIEALSRLDDFPDELKESRSAGTWRRRSPRSSAT